MKFNYQLIQIFVTRHKKKLLISFVLLSLYALLNFTYSYFSNLPKPVTKYEGISLGMSMDEVMYTLGYPSVVLYEDTDQIKLANGQTIKGSMLIHVTPSYMSKNNKSASDYFYWQYDVGGNTKSKRVDIEFNEETKLVQSIGCYVNDSDWVSANTCLINGIQSLDSEEHIINRLGKPSHEKIEGVTKNLVYSNFNMSIYLARKTAYYIKVEKKNTK